MIAVSTPRWLLPVVATGAALAVGVGAAFVGSGFAAPQAVEVETPTIDVPVLAPVESGVSLAETIAAADDSGGIAVGPVTGVREVVDPEAGVESGPLPADIEALVDAMAEADDPEEVPVPAAESVDEAAPAGDPCADGGAGCPVGVGGTILPIDGGLPWFAILADGSNSASCPAPDAADQLRFWVKISRPGTIRVGGSDGWNHPSAVFETSEAQTEAWLAEGPGTDAAPTMIEHCVELSGFREDAPVSVRVGATALDGSTNARSFTLYTSDGLAVPPTRIRPIGNSTVFVSAPHTENEHVQILLYADEAGTPACRYGSAATTSVTPVDRPRTEEVSAEYLAEHSYEPNYTRRTSATFIVPPGMSLSACVGWFTGRSTGFLPSQHPTRVSELAMVSPEVSAPVVTVSEVEFTRELAEEASIGTSTESGTTCGGWRGARDGEGVGRVVCDFGALLGWHPADGALVVRTEVPTDAGPAVNTSLLDISLLACPEGCAGRSRDYDVELSTFIRPRGLCSGDCHVDPGEIVGVVRLTATWPSVSPGHDGWALGEWHEGADRFERDPLPPLNLGESIRFGAVDTAARAQDIDFWAGSDRPVNVTAVLTPSRGGTDALCPRPGGSHSWSSTSLSELHHVEFPELCLSTIYNLAVTLTDAAGASVTYSYLRGAGERFWSEAQFSTYAMGASVVVDSLRLVNPDAERAVWLDDAVVRVASQDARLGLPGERQRCWVGDVHGLHSGVTSMWVGENLTVEVSARVRDATPVAGLETPDVPSAACDRDDSGHNQRLVFTGELSYEQYAAGARMTITDPASGWTAIVELSPDLEP